MRMCSAQSVLLDAFGADCYRGAVDGGPAGGSGEALLVADPPDVGAGVGEDVDGALELPHRLEPLLEMVRHARRVLALSAVEPDL